MKDIGEDATVDRTLWGELESESEEESEEEEEEEDKDKQVADESGLVTPAEGLVTPSGLTSIPAGMETPEAIELRKKKIESEMEGYVYLAFVTHQGFSFNLDNFGNRDNS